VTCVEICLPQELIDCLDLEDDGVRGGDLVSIMMEGVETASVVTSAAALVSQLTVFAASIRRWAGRHRRSATLALKGRHVSLVVDITPNVSTARIVKAVTQLIEHDREADQPSD
jgi:hypothetical protein